MLTLPAEEAHLSRSPLTHGRFFFGGGPIGAWKVRETDWTIHENPLESMIFEGFYGHIIKKNLGFSKGNLSYSYITRSINKLITSWLVVSNMTSIFHRIWDVILPSDELHHFFKMLF